MPIRFPRTTLPQEPAVQRAGGSSIVPFQAIGNPAQPGAQVGDQLAGLASRIYQQERDRELETRVTEIDIARRKADSEVLQGYGLKLGKDAVEGRDAVLAALQENSKQSRSGIKDAALRSAWKLQDDALTLRASEEVYGHFRTQRLAWQADTQEARGEQLIQDLGRVAFGGGYDPATGRLSDEAERTRSSLLDSVQELGAMQGWSPERIEVARRGVESRALEQVAQSLIQQDRFDEALKVLERHGDRIDVGVRDTMIGQARAAHSTQLRAAKAQSFTLQVADMATSRGGSVADQRAFALSTAEYSYRGKKLSVEEYDDVLQRMERHYGIRDRQEAATQRQTITAAERFLFENPTAVLSDDPKLLEKAKSSGSLRALLSFQESGRYATDPEAFARVRGMTDTQLRTVSADRLWVTLRPHLSNQDLDVVMARHARAAGNATPDQLHVITISDRLEKTARVLRHLPADPGERPGVEQQLRFDAWRAQFNTELQEWQTRHGKKATPEDVQQRLDLQEKDMVVVSVTQSLLGMDWAWPDTIERVPLASLPDRGEAWVVAGEERVALKRIPEREWSDIAAKLDARGVDPTAQNIAEVWVERGRPGDLQAATGGR